MGGCWGRDLNPVRSAGRPGLGAGTGVYSPFLPFLTLLTSGLCGDHSPDSQKEPKNSVPDQGKGQTSLRRRENKGQPEKALLRTSGRPALHVPHAWPWPGNREQETGLHWEEIRGVSAESPPPPGRKMQGRWPQDLLKRRHDFRLCWLDPDMTLQARPLSVCAPLIIFLSPLLRQPQIRWRGHSGKDRATRQGWGQRTPLRPHKAPAAAPRGPGVWGGAHKMGGAHLLLILGLQPSRPGSFSRKFKASSPTKPGGGHSG